MGMTEMFLAFQGRSLLTPRPAPTLSKIILSDPDLPAGWSLAKDENVLVANERESFLSEVRMVSLRRADGNYGTLEYRLFVDETTRAGTSGARR